MTLPSEVKAALREKLSDMLYANIRASEAHKHPVYDADDLLAALQPEIERLVVEARGDVISKIYGIANDLADKDPKAIGSVSLAPYLANAVAIYQEYLKGDDYERIDWKSLDLPTLTHPKQQEKKQ